MNLKQTISNIDKTLHKDQQNDYNNSPFYTIITVVRNCQDTIERTILSVINQTYSNIEFIIIDGSSTDKTLEVIKKYNDKIDLWISEPDKGIYDAMNKGIGFAHGKFVNFLNAGDVFADNNVLDKVADQYLIRQSDIIYGDFIAIDTTNNLERVIKAKPISKIWKGMIFSHQACFIKLNILKKNPFNLKYKIAADYNQICSLYILDYTFDYLPLIMATTTIDGISYSNIKTNIENIQISYTYNPNIFNSLTFIPLLVIASFKTFFGKNITSFLRKIKWIKTKLK